MRNNNTPKQPSTTHEDNWNNKYQQIWEFVNTHHRGPTRHHIEEHKLLNWLKYNRKVRRKGIMPPIRAERFKQLTDLITSFGRVNQYR